MTISSTPLPDSPEAAYEAWVNAMQSLDIDQVVALYHEEDAGFWGTLAGNWKRGRGAIRPYFEWFLDRSSLSIESREAEYRTIAPGLAISGGAYVFTLGGPKAGDPAITVSGRFTFVFQRDEATGAWCILEHHSSKMPDDPKP